MRDFYIEVIKKYVESKQMKDYLISVVDELCKWQIIDLICGARADLKDKYETLNLLAEYENDEEKKDEYQSATLAASNAKAALDELKLNQGEALLNMEYGYGIDIRDQKIYGAAPHFSLSTVMKYINEECAELDEEEKEDTTYWYRLEKYVPGVKDELDMTYTYLISPNGELWFANNGDFPRISFASSQDLNLPVPFDIGDIITIDCRPFAPLKHGVIIEKGNNRSCCCVQCAWIANNGDVRVGALKHTTVFDDKSFVNVSPLYRAEIYNGELPENERCLKEISEFVWRNEEKGMALDQIKYEKRYIAQGMSFEKVKEFMERYK